MEIILSRDGTSIACWHGGTGTPLLLVHGTTSDHSAWSSTLTELQQHFTVWTVDRRGRGQSGDTDNYALEREYEDVATVVDAIGGSVNLVGHSFGGLCALEASLLTANIKKLILYEPSISLAGSGWSTELECCLQALLEQGNHEGSLLLFFRDMLRASEQEIADLQASPNWPARIAAAHTLLRELQGIDRYIFLPQRFSSLQNPVLLLLGEDSHTRRYITTENLKQSLPHSRIGILAGQQHSAMRTAPELFAHMVIDFLTSKN